MIDAVKFLLNKEAERVHAEKNKQAGNANQKGVDECNVLLSQISLLKQSIKLPEHSHSQSENTD